MVLIWNLDSSRAHRNITSLNSTENLLIDRRRRKQRLQKREEEEYSTSLTLRVE